MSAPDSGPTRVAGDRLRVAFLALAFAALGWSLLTLYSGSTRFDPHRRLLREFFRAARARDTVRIRALVSSEEPLRWALATAARQPPILPDPDGELSIRGASRSPGVEEIAVWARGVCSEQPLFVTLVGDGRDRRIASVQTVCKGEP